MLVRWQNTGNFLPTVFGSSLQPGVANFMLMQYAAEYCCGIQGGWRIVFCVPPRRMRIIANRRQNEWNATFCCGNAEKKVAYSMHHRLIKICSVQYLQGVLGWHRLAVWATNIRFQGIAKAAIFILISA